MLFLPSSSFQQPSEGDIHNQCHRIVTEFRSSEAEPPEKRIHDTALLKALYLATFEATKKWTVTMRNWAGIWELSIMYEGRLPE